MSKYKCPTCGAEDVQPFGVCKVCFKGVCPRCGTKQITMNGTFITHSACFNEHPELIGPSFKLFKFKPAKR